MEFELDDALDQIKAMAKSELEDLIVGMSFSPYKYVAYKASAESLWGVPVMKIKHICYWEKPIETPEGYTLVDVSKRMY